MSGAVETQTPPSWFDLDNAGHVEWLFKTRGQQQSVIGRRRAGLLDDQSRVVHAQVNECTQFDHLTHCAALASCQRLLDAFGAGRVADRCATGGEGVEEALRALMAIVEEARAAETPVEDTRWVK